ncbi:MAG: RNA methyltransferase [Thermoleophilia bacterium]
MITSRDNARLRLVRRLASRRQRERLGLLVAEGEDLVEAALDAGLAPVEALVDAERPALADRLPEAALVAPGLLAELSELAHAARVVAVFRRADLPRVDPAALPAVGLALWRVGDPGNVGTLLRAADALGPACVCLSAGCADPASPKALRAGAGATFRVPVGAFDDAPRPWVALVPRDGEPLAEVGLGAGATFVLGAEREGLPDDVLTRCDLRATIPQAAGAESLNVAIAGSIALYELRRR